MIFNTIYYCIDSRQNDNYPNRTSVFTVINIVLVIEITVSPA